MIANQAEAAGIISAAATESPEPAPDEGCDPDELISQWLDEVADRVITESQERPHPAWDPAMKRLETLRFRFCRTANPTEVAP